MSAIAAGKKVLSISFVNTPGLKIFSDDGMNVLPKCFY
jgi:hypothetical protein